MLPLPDNLVLKLLKFCARHDAVQTHHLLVLREDVESRTHPEPDLSPEMPRLDAMRRQGSESPKRRSNMTGTFGIV